MRSSRHWICCETAATDRAEPPSQLYAADVDAVDCASEQHAESSFHNASQTYRSRLQIQQDCHILMADAIVSRLSTEISFFKVLSGHDHSVEAALFVVGGSKFDFGDIACSDRDGQQRPMN